MLDTSLRALQMAAVSELFGHLELQRHSSLVGSCGYLSLFPEKSSFLMVKWLWGHLFFSALCGCCCRAVNCAALKQLRIWSQELSDRAC